MNTPASPSSAFATLAREKADRFRSVGAFGKPAYQNHVQLKAMLRAKRGEKFANYLAKPSYDPDAAELRWTAEVPGAARRWSELDEKDQGKAALNLGVIRSGLLGFVDELRVQGGDQPGGAAAFATLLEQAMKVPAQGEFLYFVGDQPVIAFWGFQDQDGRSVDPSLVAPRYAPTAAGGLSPITGPAATGLPVVMAERKRPWWWWLLWGLLALLLLLALLFGLRACGPDGSFDPGRVLPGLGNTPEGSASMPADGSPRPQGDGRMPDGSVGPGGTSPGGVAGDGTASPGTGTDPAIGAASAPGADAPPTPDAPKDPNQPPDPKTEPNKPETPPDGKPPEDKKDDKKEDPKDAKKGDKPRTDPPAPPVDPKALKIPNNPEDAKKMDFLQGDWKAGEGLADNKTQQPLDLSVKFGKDGKGELTLRRPDGSTCKGPVQGRMSGTKLSVEGSQSIPCSSGEPYSPPKIECAPDNGGQTPCTGVNRDGSRYFLGMRKQ